jgi:hypothetical protein
MAIRPPCSAGSNVFDDRGREAAGAVPTIDLTDDELAAVTAAIQRLINEDKFSRAPTRCARRWPSSIRRCEGRSPNRPRSERGAPLNPKRSTQRFCSEICRGAHRATKAAPPSRTLLGTVAAAIKLIHGNPVTCETLTLEKCQKHVRSLGVPSRIDRVSWSPFFGDVTGYASEEDRGRHIASRMSFRAAGKTQS